MVGQPSRRRRLVHYDDSPFMTLLVAAFFLWLGFYRYVDVVSEVDNSWHQRSIDAAMWTFRGFGIALLLLALLGFARIHARVYLRLLIEALGAIAFIAIGATWLVFSDMNGILALIVGLFEANAAKRTWAAIDMQAKLDRAPYTNDPIDE